MLFRQWLIDVLFTGNGSSPSCMINPSTRCVRTKGLAAPDGCWTSVVIVWLTVGGWTGCFAFRKVRISGEKLLSTGGTSNGWVMEDWMGDMSEERLEIARKMKTVMILPTVSINAPSYLRTLYGVLSYILRYRLSLLKLYKRHVRQLGYFSGETSEMYQKSSFNLKLSCRNVKITREYLWYFFYTDKWLCTWVIVWLSGCFLTLVVFLSWPWCDRRRLCLILLWRLHLAVGPRILCADCHLIQDLRRRDFNMFIKALL